MKKVTEICLYLFLTVFAFSCRSVKESTNQSEYSKDSVYIIEKPVLVNVPGSIVQTQSINIDSLANLLRSGVSPQVISRTLIKEDPETGLKLGILIDHLGNLTAVCEQQDRMIQNLQKEIFHQREMITKFESEKVVTKLPFWVYLVAGITLLFFVAYILIRLRII